MQRPDPKQTMLRRELIDFVDLATLLKITQSELVKLIDSPHFPRKVDDLHRGHWRRSEIAAYIARAQHFQARPSGDGPRAA